MTQNKLKANLDKLHELKVRIGNLTYGEASKAKYAMNNLTRKIEEMIAFLQSMDLPEELIEDRNKATAQIESAFMAINQEYAKQKPDSRGHEVISTETNRQSDIIRRTLGDFDASALAKRLN